MPLKTGVYFFLRPFRSALDAGYQHRSIAIAEGLRSLGVPTYSNVPYWRLAPGSEETLFRVEKAITPQDCDIVVAEHVYFDAERDLPPAFHDSRRKHRTVFIDAADGWRTASMLSCWKCADLVLRCHYNARFEHGKNVRPWAFGLSERILEAVQDAGRPSDRKRSLACNYRASHPVRRLAEMRVIPLLSGTFEIDREVDALPPSDPYDLLMWEQSGRRHHPSYYARLKLSIASGAFGGYFVPSFSRSLNSIPLRIAHKIGTMLRLSTGTVAQFDSWRFWESLAAGCLTFHVDLGRYGCRLPVMPLNSEHYIGVDFSNPSAGLASVTQGSIDIDAVALAGKEWAMRNYSPAASAKRFLEYVGV